MAVDSKALFAQVRANHDRLNGCTDHDFQPDLNDARLLMRRYTCTRCDGEIDGLAARWYRLGRDHEANSPSRSNLGAG